MAQTTAPTDRSKLLATLTIDETMPDAPFDELHQRIVASPIDDVWPHCLAVTAQEIRTLGPLMAIRSLPSRLTSSRSVSASAPLPLLEVFESEGFVVLRQDERPDNGMASVLFGAAGRFWSIAHNAPKQFRTAQDFVDFQEPGWAKTVCRLDAIDLGDGRTRIETETRVIGTDAASTRKFAPYWAVIRLPSGAIRRSWLAAIDRRATR